MDKTYTIIQRQGRPNIWGDARGPDGEVMKFKNMSEARRAMAGMHLQTVEYRIVRVERYLDVEIVSNPQVIIRDEGAGQVEDSPVGDEED